jgi:acyl-coenzyme A thioesterase PaaI-like protein
METQSFADLDRMQAALTSVFAQWVQRLDMRVLDARAGEVVLALPVTREHVHAGGVLCGQTMMAAAHATTTCTLL